jgi:hypothetical protein
LAAGVLLMHSDFFLYGATGAGSLSFIRVLVMKISYLDGLPLDTGTFFSISKVLMILPESGSVRYGPGGLGWNRKTTRIDGNLDLDQQY